MPTFFESSKMGHHRMEVCEEVSEVQHVSLKSQQSKCFLTSHQGELEVNRFSCLLVVHFVMVTLIKFLPMFKIQLHSGL